MCKDIAKVLIMKKFMMPKMKFYSGTNDPYDHVGAYKGAMLIVPLRMIHSKLVSARGSPISLMAQCPFTHLQLGNTDKSLWCDFHQDINHITEDNTT